MPTKRNQDFLDLRHPSDKKASKPLMEKRRRARINHSLAQLKALVIDPNTTERSRQTKLEKADILELTVRHLHEIKRQQRTALLLETRHPKKKFEVGYSECVREVELFLSTIIDLESSGANVEVQNRLKEHLNKRLQDFRNIEPLDVSSKKETSDEELNDEPSSSPSSSVSNTAEDLPSSEEREETSSSDSSALNKMLKYYADNKKNLKRQEDAKSLKEDLPPKRLKMSHIKLNEKDCGVSFSCPSVTSTTGYRLSDVSTGPLKSEKYFENTGVTTASKTGAAENRFISCSDASNMPDPPRTVKSGMDRKTRLLKALSQGNSNDHGRSPRTGHSDDNKLGQSTSAQNKKCVDQIPLVPRQLANGDWALVLPASLVPTAKEDSYPFSAFKLVVPTNSTSPDFDADILRQRPHSSSPLSSTVSDMSYEEFCSRYDGDPAERMDHSSPDSTQVVWRPW